MKFFHPVVACWFFAFATANVFALDADHDALADGWGANSHHPLVADYMVSREGGRV